jgi:hypothetical protein
MALRRALIAAALALAATPAAAAAKPVNPRISPHGGHPDTVFRVGFTAPKPTGKHGQITRNYRISLTLDGGGKGCTSFAERFVDTAKAGERVHRRFVPETPWCRGLWIGTVGMEENTPCNKFDKPCPGMPSGGAPIAQFHFRVRG